MVAMDDEVARRARLQSRLEHALDSVALEVEGRTGVKARELRAKIRSYRRVLAYWGAVVPTHAQESALAELVDQLRDARHVLADTVSGVRRLDGAPESGAEYPLPDRRVRK